MDLFTEIDTDLQIQDFGECIDKCASCDVMVSIKQTVESADDLEDVKVIDLQSIAFESTNEIEIPNNDFIYLRIRSFAEDYKKLYALWDTVMKRGHTRYMQGFSNDYFLCVDLIKEDEPNNRAYRMQFIGPIFIGRENGLYVDNNTLLLVFRADAASFDIEDVDYLAVYDADQYSNELARQAVEDDTDDEEDDEDFFAPDDDTDVENADIISTDDITSNDDFLL